MRLPVSQDVVQAMIAEFQKREERWNEAMQIQQSRYDALLQRYHDLKMSGAAPVAATITLPAPTKRDDPVTQAIYAKCRGDVRLFRHYQTFVAERRAIGCDEADIAKEILTGIDDTGE